MFISVVIGLAVMLACWWMLTRTSRQLRKEFHSEVERLSDIIRDHEHKSVAKITEKKTSGESENGNRTIIPDIRMITDKFEEDVLVFSHSRESTEISPETQEAIKATLSASLGQNVRIHSIKLLENHDPPMTWASQGRMAVQSSHNQRVERG
jgi:hypothetical protein